MAAEMLKDCEWESASEELVVSKKPLKSIPLLDLTNSPDSKPRKPPNSIENDEVIARILQESLNQESKDTAPPPLKPSETFKTPLVISPKKPSTAFSNQPAYRKVDMSKLSLIEGKLLYAYKPEDLDLRPSTGFKESMQNKARAPPLAGTREIPYGDPSCLSGKTFLVTGNLDFMDRAQAVEIIKKHGGKVAENVTKQVNICLAGNGFGPAKIKTIIERKLPILTEEGLFEYLQSTIVGKEIVNKPAPPKKIDITFTSNEDTSTYLWTDKYQPKRICDLIGNTQSVAAIVEWLKNWNKNTKVIVPETKGKAAKSSFQKALLLSGPPGIGKSSSIKTIANELGFNVIETNASDKRSKLSVMDFLKEVSQSNGIQSLLKSDKKDHFTKSLLIMDEVDGMSTGDKGGNKELCLAIPTAKIPIICICNDREKDSIKTLSKHCQDIRFTKPLPQQILPRIKSILDVEGQKLTDSQINQVLESCNGDIRQVLNLLQMWHTKSTSALGEQISKTKKDLDLGAFEIVPKFFTPKLSISAKLDFYFMDSYFLPLHVQDVYIDCGDNNIDKISRAADSLSEGDLIGKAIHRDQDYELMPLEALLTCIRPPILSGTVGFRGFIKIPTWFGKNSKQNKLKKYVQTLHSHIAPRTMADVTSTLDYLPLLSKHLTQPLSNGQEGVQQIISFMEFHDMDKEDRDNILEILEFGADPLESVSAQQKSSFTRLWNKEHFDFRQVNQKGKAIKSADKSDTSETERSTKQRKKEPKAAPKKRKAAAPKEPKKPRKAASKK
uniref:Replication factor C subunit 1 n=1 Tax=Arcella intermedia TaxID=1963864 RepID=A0A6B2KY57_9EUKA